uniref:Uncharacterized protein n=1 Tax=Calcidiscus leptoporus TaxID=127549 RepID=A0A7S0NWC7_9EUKA|mmetsp:Transcript_33586/g.78570  ORF Transcript_33586/g.78570 Transcript_33586/m.78570 type:complete len:522 (+) Transcript_33586:24-1589(+)
MLHARVTRTRMRLACLLACSASVVAMHAPRSSSCFGARDTFRATQSVAMAASPSSQAEVSRLRRALAAAERTASSAERAVARLTNAKEEAAALKKEVAVANKEAMAAAKALAASEARGLKTAQALEDLKAAAKASKASAAPTKRAPPLWGQPTPRPKLDPALAAARAEASSLGAQVAKLTAAVATAEAEAAAAAKTASAAIAAAESQAAAAIKAAAESESKTAAAAAARAATAKVARAPVRRGGISFGRPPAVKAVDTAAEALRAEVVELRAAREADAAMAAKLQARLDEALVIRSTTGLENQIRDLAAEAKSLREVQKKTSAVATARNLAVDQLKAAQEALKLTEKKAASTASAAAAAAAASEATISSLRASLASGEARRFAAEAEVRRLAALVSNLRSRPPSSRDTGVEQDAVRAEHIAEYEQLEEAAKMLLAKYLWDQRMGRLKLAALREELDSASAKAAERAPVAEAVAVAETPSDGGAVLATGLIGAGAGYAASNFGLAVPVLAMLEALRSAAPST